MNNEEQAEYEERRTVSDFLGDVPWWAVIITGVGIYVLVSMLTNALYITAFKAILPGVRITLEVTFFAYLLALILGLIAGMFRVSRNPVLYALGTLYVEVTRGLPMLVIILYAGFVIGPAIRDATHKVVDLPMLSRAIIGLGIGYGAYLAEVYRAGIESVHGGQIEAARSLGMSYLEAMRFVILPQAIRRVLPPLGNNFIALLKDTSLVSVVAIPDLLQMGRLFISRTFRAFEGYNSVAVLYLLMTFLLSALVRYVERRWRIP